MWAMLSHSWLEVERRKHTNDRLQGTLYMLVLKALASRGGLPESRTGRS